MIVVQCFRWVSRQWLIFGKKLLVTTQYKNENVNKGVRMEKYLEMLKEGGAIAAIEIDPATVVTAPWVVFKCQFGCNRYGTSRVCPPRTPTYQHMREILDSFNRAILFSCPSLTAVKPLAVDIAKEIFFDGFYRVITLGAGPCLLCKECDLDKCRNPQKAIPAMESCGIDVFATARAHGFQISTLRERGEPVINFGLILVD